jgi:hypothetical protein
VDYGGLDLSKREAPHRAVINFNIDIRALDDNGSPEAFNLSDERLSKYNIGKRAEIMISGISEADCIQNVKRRLEKLNE